MGVALKLYRDDPEKDHTFGVLSALGLVLQTIERPWLPDPNHLGGQNGVSCVPRGSYRLELHDTELHPRTWALVNHDLGVFHYPGDIPHGWGGRSAVLIHPANFAHELLGCIAPGTGRSESEDGTAMVINSRVAYAQLHQVLAWIEGHTLTIDGVNP